MRKKHIPIFVSASDASAPHLAVTLQSIYKGSSDEFVYDVRIFDEGLSRYNVRKLRHMRLEGVKISFIDPEEIILKAGESSPFERGSAFYAIFAASLYPRLRRVIYLEAGDLVMGDISKIYFGDLNARIPLESYIVTHSTAQPWNDPRAPYADEFWDAARSTPFYDRMLDLYIDSNTAIIAG